MPSKSIRSARTAPKRNQGKQQLQHVDILILHGKSLDIVGYLVSLFESLDLVARKMVDLPSGGMVQERKVDHYLKSCRVPLVLATFDEENPGTSRARPNVYDEMARCRHLRPNDTLVLREHVASSFVDLPSNVEGHLSVIPFEKTRVHEAIPSLLREIRTLGLLTSSPPAGTAMEAGSILNAFLDAMDLLWDNQFDVAWKSIHRRDYAAERNFANTLDQFFQCYHAVFDALARQGKRGNELSLVCNASHSTAVALAARAWEYVAEAKLTLADNEVEVAAREKTGRKYQNIYDDAASRLREAKRASMPDEKIKLYRKVVESVDSLVGHLRK